MSEHVKYTPEIVTEKLLQPIRFYTSTKLPFTPTNESYDFPTDSEVIKILGPRVPVYMQRDESTCTTWAITNALTSLGIRPDPQILSELLNYTLEEDKGLGLRFETAWGLVSISFEHLSASIARNRNTYRVGP